jgi:hypothetical protein
MDCGQLARLIVVGIRQRAQHEQDPGEFRCKTAARVLEIERLPVEQQMPELSQLLTDLGLVPTNVETLN